MVDSKMLCGILHNKNFGDNVMMARISDAAYATELAKPNCLPMYFTGRPMKGNIYVTPNGYDSDSDLSYWIDACLAFNPLAKAINQK